MSVQKKKSINYKKLLLLIIIIFFLFIIIINTLFSNKKSLRSSNTLLIIGDSVQNLENDIFIDSENNIYISYDDIKHIYDENIFYDEVNKKIITTYNKHIAILELDKNEIEINDAKSTINGNLKFIDNVLYLPLSDMKLVYDFEYYISDSTNRVILDSISKNKSTGKINNNTKVKENSSLFSKSILKIDKDEEVFVFNESKNYCKIRTQDGIIGYVKKNKISDFKDLRHDMEDNKFSNVNLLSNYSEIKSDYNNLKLDNKKYNVVLPKFLNLEENKSVNLNVSTKSNEYNKYIQWIQNNNVNLWVKITADFDVSSILSTYDNRKEIINNIYSKLVENNYKILNIDFQNINDINSFYRFIIEITPRLRESGIKTVVTYNNKMNEEKISKIVDYVIKEDK